MENIASSGIIILPNGRCCTGSHAICPYAVINAVIFVLRTHFRLNSENLYVAKMSIDVFFFCSMLLVSVSTAYVEYKRENLRDYQFVVKRLISIVTDSRGR